MAENDEPRWIKTGFNQPVDDLIKNGPTATVEIAALPYATGDRVWAFSALIDTGASGTGISPRVVREVGLRPTGSGVIREAGREPLTTNLYRARLSLPYIHLDLPTIAGLPTMAPPHDIIVGRDVLRRVRLSVDFTTGVTRLHFRV